MKTIKISDKTFDKIKEQLQDDFEEINTFEDFKGKCFYFISVTFHYVGRVTKIINDTFKLECASWVADSGRFMQAIKDGELDEVEPVGRMYLNSKSLVCSIPWKHELPTEQK